MATLTRNTYAAKQWHEITAGSILTQINHNWGKTAVVYTEDTSGLSLAIPYTDATPAYMRSEVGDVLYFTDVDHGKSIYFFPLYTDVDLTITKG